MQKQQVSIRAVAKRSKVSICTVSNVLHNKEGVGDKTRKRVLRTIRKLNYDPVSNIPLAQNIKTSVLGLVLPAGDFLIDPFYNRAIKTVKEYTTNTRYDLLLLSETDLARKLEDETQSNIFKNTCGGVIHFCPRKGWDHPIDSVKNLGIPQVLVRRITTVPGIPMLVNDDYAGVRKVLDHLGGQGHIAIGFIGRFGKQFPVADPVVAAYRDFCKEHRMAYNKTFMYNLGIPEQDTFDQLKAWVKECIGEPKKITAFFCGNDDIAISMIKVLHSLGLQVPEEVALAGFSDNPQAEQASPGITTVNIPVEKMCTWACDLLIGPAQNKMETTMPLEFESNLVVRESSGNKKGKGKGNVARKTNSVTATVT